MLSEATAFAVNPSLVCLGDVGPEAFADYNIRVLLPGSSTLGYRVELTRLIKTQREKMRFNLKI
ncbi:hypothetical protein LEMLEM_LOCUS12920 [Lemmus lemmus]